MSLSVVRMAERNVFSHNLKDTSESLSLTVFGKTFQVCGAEKRKARLVKSVRTNGSDSCILVVGLRVRTLSHVMMWWLRYVGI